MSLHMTGTLSKVKKKKVFSLRFLFSRKVTTFVPEPYLAGVVRREGKVGIRVPTLKTSCVSPVTFRTASGSRKSRALLKDGTPQTPVLRHRCSRDLYGEFFTGRPSSLPAGEDLLRGSQSTNRCSEKGVARAHFCGLLFRSRRSDEDEDFVFSGPPPATLTPPLLVGTPDTKTVGPGTRVQGLVGGSEGRIVSTADLSLSRPV